MPGEGLPYFVATTLLSVVVLAASWWTGHKRERATPWLMGGALLLLIAKAVLHQRPDWETARCCLTGSWGTSTFDMYRGLLVKLRDTDLRPQVVHLDVEDLRGLDRPAIVGHGSRHAWGIRVDGDNVECLDPLYGGPRTVAFEQFADEFTGFAVLLDQPPERPRDESPDRPPNHPR